MAASENNRHEFVKWLLDKGASVNASMNTGWTAMHAAAKHNHHDVLATLLANGGDKEIRASHRSFGRSLTVMDVTADPKTLRMLQ
jgi:ankyrin repeat protein